MLKEVAAPLLQNADRVVDASTLRRWLQRRLTSWVGILAWDWPASFRMLIAEPKPT